MNDGADWTRQREIEAACAGLTTLDRMEGRGRTEWLGDDSERMTGRRTIERERQSPDGPRFLGLSRNHRMIDRRYHRRGGRGEIIRRTAAAVSGFLLATRRLPEPTEPRGPVHRHRDRFLPDQRGWVGHVGWPPSNTEPSISKSWPLDFQHGKSLPTRRERETKKPAIAGSEPSVSLSSTAVTMRS